jgi:hypothetical protein
MVQFFLLSNSQLRRFSYSIGFSPIPAFVYSSNQEKILKNRCHKKLFSITQQYLAFLFFFVFFLSTTQTHDKQTNKYKKKRKEKKRKKMEAQEAGQNMHHPPSQPDTAATKRKRDIETPPANHPLLAKKRTIASTATPLPFFPPAAAAPPHPHPHPPPPPRPPVLPNELWALIFDALDEGMCAVARLVCKLWCDLVPCYPDIPLPACDGRYPIRQCNAFARRGHIGLVRWLFGLHPPPVGEKSFATTLRAAVECDAFDIFALVIETVWPPPCHAGFSGRFASALCCDVLVGDSDPLDYLLLIDDHILPDAEFVVRCMPPPAGDNLLRAIACSQCWIARHFGRGLYGCETLCAIAGETGSAELLDFAIQYIDGEMDRDVALSMCLKNALECERANVVRHVIERYPKDGRPCVYGMPPASILRFSDAETFALLANFVDLAELAPEDSLIAAARNPHSTHALDFLADGSDFHFRRDWQLAGQPPTARCLEWFIANHPTDACDCVKVLCRSRNIEALVSSLLPKSDTSELQLLFELFCKIEGEAKAHALLVSSTTNFKSVGVPSVAALRWLDAMGHPPLSSLAVTAALHAARRGNVNDFAWLLERTGSPAERYWALFYQAAFGANAPRVCKWMRLHRPDLPTSLKGDAFDL